MALPVGWIDTGIVKTLTISFTLELSAAVFYPGHNAHVDFLEFYTDALPGAADLGHAGLWDGSGGLGTSFDFQHVEMYNQLTGTRTVLAGTSGAGSSSGDPGYLPAIPIQAQFTSLRLGATMKNGALVYSWFSEPSSGYTLTVNGSVVYTLTGGGTALTADGPGGGVSYRGQGPVLGFQVGNVNTNFVPATGTSEYNHVRFGSFVGDGVSLTPPYPVEFKLPAAAGFTDYVFDGLAHSFGCPFRYILDLDAVDSDGTAEAAGYTHPALTPGTCPGSPTATELFFDGSVGGTDGHVLTQPELGGAWLAAQAVTPYASDRPFTWEGNAPLDPNNASPTEYTVGALTVAPTVNVLNSSNAWSATLGTVVITGTPVSPIFTVAAGPWRVTRTLAESWRDWNTPAHGDYESDDLYRTTKHDYYASGATDDAWGWGLYRYLDIDMTVPAGADTELAFEVLFAIAGTGNTIGMSYADVTFPAGGRSVQRVDLMFPIQESRPFYGERADQVILAAAGTGAFTLHDITLAADEDTYLKIGGNPWVNADGGTIQGGLVLSQDGAAPALLWGLDARQTLFGDRDRDDDTWDDFDGDHENGRFLQNGTGRAMLGKAPGMDAATIEDVLLEADRMEGLTATHTDANLAAALTDGTNTLLETSTFPETAVVREAHWLYPRLPHVRLTPGTPYTVTARLAPTGIVVPAGCTPADMRVFCRNRLGAVVEVLATDADFNSVGAGSTVKLRAYTGSPGSPAPADTLLATASTDASGYAPLPHRTGTIGALEFTAYVSEN